MLNWFKAEYLIFPLLTLLFSLALTRILIAVLPFFGYVDKPDQRRIHKKIMPRGGGIGIFLSSLFGSLIYYWLDPTPVMWSNITHFYVPAAILFVTGLIDDRIGMNRFLKLFAHILAASLVWYFGVRFTTLFGWPLPTAVSAVITVFWILVFINGFNLIDGMDGAAAGLAVISSLCLASWMILLNETPSLTVFILIMTGSCLGFLRYNFSPARIFMGDTGSMFLGYFFAYCSLAGIGKAATITSLILPMLAVGVPLFDVLLAFWRRFVRKMLHKPGSGIMSADLQHLHHRLLKQEKQEKGKQRRVAIRLYSIALLFVLFGTFIQLTCKIIPVLGFLLVLFLVLLMVRRLAGIELYSSTMLLQKGFRRPRKPIIVMTLIPLQDLFLLYVSIVFAVRYLSLPPIDIKEIFFLLLPIPILTMLCGGYNIYWFRSGAEEIRKYLKILVLGVLVSAIIFWLRPTNINESMARPFIALYLLGGTFLLVACRIIFIYMGTRFLWQLKQDADLKTRPRVVVVGGGKNANTYISDHLCRPSGIKILGIIDDDPALTGMRVYGLNILGQVDRLEEVYQKTPFDRLVITTSRLRRDKLAKLVSFAEKNNVKLTRFIQLEREVQNTSELFTEETPATF